MNEQLFKFLLFAILLLLNFCVGISIKPIFNINNLSLWLTGAISGIILGYIVYTR